MITSLVPQGAELTQNKNQPNGYAGVDVNGDLVGPIVFRILSSISLPATSLEQGEVAFISDTHQVVIGNSTTLGDITAVSPIANPVGSAPPDNPAAPYSALWVSRTTSATSGASKIYIANWGNDQAANFTGDPFSFVWDPVTFTAYIGTQNYDLSSIDPGGFIAQCHTALGAITFASLALFGQFIIGTQNEARGGGSGSTIVTSNLNNPEPGDYLLDATTGNRTVTLNITTWPNGYWIIKRVDSSGNTLSVVEAGAKNIDLSPTARTIAGLKAMHLWAHDGALWIMNP